MQNIFKQFCAAFVIVSITACGASSPGPFGLGNSAKGETYSPDQCKAALGFVVPMVDQISDPSQVAAISPQQIVDFVQNLPIHAQCTAQTTGATDQGRKMLEDKLVDLVAALRNSEAAATLDRALEMLVEGAVAAGSLPGVGEKVEQVTHKPMKIIDKVQELNRKIDGQLCLHGRLNTCAGRAYVPWDALAARHERFLFQSHVELKFGEAGFKEELEYLTNSTFVGGNRLRLMTNGPEALDYRLDLINNVATESIYLVTWSIYDDNTGKKVTDALLARAAEGIEVKVLVDGQTAEREHHRDNVNRLDADPNVTVVRFRGKPGRQFDGNHRKLFIVDQKYAIAGGRNIGDKYFNDEDDADEKGWRDNEMVMEGPVVRQAMELFAKLWSGESQGSVVPAKLPQPAAGNAVVAVTDQVPAEVTHNEHVRPGVTLSIIKALYGAKTRVDIENAYFILTPDIEAALKKALERGVQVNILSNSLHTIDQPEIAGPILASLQRMLEAGAHIYLRTGTMLHSKIMVVDDRYAWVGSYNIHPRSYWYEGEMAVQVLEDPSARPAEGSFVQQLRGAFDADMATAQHVETVTDLGIPAPSILGVLIDRFFFDAL